MTRVGNTDQIMALVRSQLQRMAKRERSGKNQKVDRPGTRVLTQQERVQALREIRDLTEEEFTRGLVRAFLTEEFGEAIAGSSGFQQAVESTSRVIQADPQILALLRQVRQEL